MCQQVKIVISMDGVLVLINVVIANLIQVDLVLCVVLFCEVGATIMAQAKDDLYIAIDIQQPCFFLKS